MDSSSPCKHMHHGAQLGMPCRHSGAVDTRSCACRFGRWCLDRSGLSKGGVAGIIVAGVVVLAGSTALLAMLVRTLKRWDTPDPVARAAEAARLQALEVGTLGCRNCGAGLQVMFWRLLLLYVGMMVG